MEDYFNKLMQRVKTIQETTDAELTNQDRQAIHSRLIADQEYEKNLLIRDNKGMGIAEYEKYCSDNAQAIWANQKKRYLEAKSIKFIASYYRENYGNDCAQILESDTLQYLNELHIDDFPTREKLLSNSPEKDAFDHLTILENDYYILLLFGHTRSAAIHYLSRKSSLFRNALNILPERECLPDEKAKEAYQAIYRIKDKIDEIAQDWAAEWERQGTCDEAKAKEIYLELRTLRRKQKYAQPELEPEPLNTTINVRTKQPDLYCSPMDKVSMKLFTAFQEFENGNALVNTGTSRKPAAVSVQIMYDDGDNSTLPPLTLYEKAVLNGLCTLWEAGRQGPNELYFTPDMLYKAMTGNKKAKIREEREKELDKTIWKLASYKVTINAESEQKMYKDPIPYRVKGHLIDIRQAETDVTINGQKVPTLYRMSTEPILYTYAKRKKQINQVPIKIINVPVNQTDSVIALKNYLLWRISWNTAGNSVTVRYDAIFKALGIDPENRANRKKKSKLYSDTKKILDYWQDLETIKSYEILDSKGHFPKRGIPPFKISIKKC